MSVCFGNRLVFFTTNVTVINMEWFFVTFHVFHDDFSAMSPNRMKMARLDLFKKKKDCKSIKKKILK